MSGITFEVSSEEQEKQLEEFIKNVSYSTRPDYAVDDPRKSMPTEEIRLKLISFERLDQCYDFLEMKEVIAKDQDVGAWWVYWVFQCTFVWRFLFAKDLTCEGQRSEEYKVAGEELRESFKKAIGDALYKKKIDDTLAYLEAVGETVEQNV